ncbi:MAG: hypothetical protein OEW24_10085 [Chloroflexota bacterium]|nr:hypothetical protein [Chloroflexota bacterium]
MASHRHRTRYPYGESVTLGELELTREQLAVAAVASAQDGVRALEQLGMDPGDALRQRAAGDPDRVAAFVDAHRPPGTANAVA